ncbi:MAG: carboxypeptidase-like regulatory domain-containing protein [Planctomycetota bacterium]
MSASRRALPLLVLLFLALGLGGILFWGGRSGPDPEPPLVPPAETARAESERGARRPVELIPPPVLPSVGREALVTTVLWPVKVELTLVQADYLPTEAGVAPIGSGATAKLTGRITGVDDRGARAEIRFAAGANAGRVLYTDATGRFGASDLYPGLAVVEVEGKGLLGSRREVRLRQRRETHLNVGYGRPAAISGRVQNTKGEGIEGAAVVVDGTRVVTGPDGGFYLASVAAGPVLVEIECLGYASHKESVSLTGGKMLPPEEATFTLRRGATLTISVSDQVGGPGPVQVVLLPAQLEHTSDMAQVQRGMGYPWHRIHPIEVWPGRPHRLDGLPAGVVRLHAFRPGALAPAKVVTLHEGRPSTVTVPLTPAPKVVGRVLRDGEPVAGAQVKIEAPDRVRATLGYFREQSYFLESAVMPELPAAAQELVTGDEGRFSFTAWADVSQVRYLEAVGPDGKTWAGRLVHPGEEVIDLELQEVEVADSTLVVDFPDRWQGLPVEILIDGQPFDPLVLPPSEPLAIGDLRAGKWHLEVTWYGDPLFGEDSLVLSATTHREIALPPEAIDGQTPEQWKRAGKEYPRGS